MISAREQQKLQPWDGPESYRPTFDMFIRKGSDRAV